MALDTKKLFDVRGKVALITGGTGAFGRIASLGLTNAGAKVVITASNKAGLEKVAAEVRAAGGDVQIVARRAETESARGFAAATVGAVEVDHRKQ